MGHPHGTPGLRLLKFLTQGRGTRTIMEISRRQADGRLLAQARPELEGLIVECAGRSARSKRPVRRVFLTMKGWAACAALRPGWEPRRLPVAVLKEWFEELRQEGDEWANSFDRKNAVLREKLAVFENLKARGLIYPSPILRKTRKDAKNPAAMLKRDLKREAREAVQQAPARADAQIYQGGSGFTNPTPVAGKIPSGARVATAPRPAPKPPTLTRTGFRCRECECCDTSEHEPGCPHEGKREGSFTLGNPKTLAQNPLLVKQLRENVDAKQAALSANCLICQSDKKLQQNTPHDCARYQAA